MENRWIMVSDLLNRTSSQIQCVGLLCVLSKAGDLEILSNNVCGERGFARRHEILQEGKGRT